MFRCPVSRTWLAVGASRRFFVPTHDSILADAKLQLFAWNPQPRVQEILDVWARFRGGPAGQRLSDLVQIVTAIHRLPKWETAIQLGGQSLTAWLKQYDIELPAFERGAASY